MNFKILTFIVIAAFSGLCVYSQGPAGGRGNRDPEVPKAKVYIYSLPAGAGCANLVNIDGLAVATLRCGRYLPVSMLPGNHSISVGNQKIRVAARIDSPVFLKLGAHSSHSRVALSPVSTEAAASDLKKCRKIAAGDVKNAALVDLEDSSNSY